MLSLYYTTAIHKFVSTFLNSFRVTRSIILILKFFKFFLKRHIFIGPIILIVQNLEVYLLIWLLELGKSNLNSEKIIF